MTKSRIKAIYFHNKKYSTAPRRSSVTLTLSDELNLSRGDMLVRAGDLPAMDKEVTATVSWMDAHSLVTGKKYKVQHGVYKVLAKVDAIIHKIHPDYSGIEENVSALQMNDIAKVRLRLNKPIFYDRFKEHRTNGSFIILDSSTNNTAGVGFID